MKTHLTKDQIVELIRIETKNIDRIASLISFQKLSAAEGTAHLAACADSIRELLTLL